MKVKLIDSKSIVGIWADIKPYIERALEHTDDYTAEQCKVFLTNGSWCLVVITNEDKLCGVITVFVENGVNHRTAFITTIGGRGIINKEAIEQFFSLLKESGITRVQGLARNTLVRLYERFGLHKKSNLVEITL
jgi:hypothetical protein